MVRQISCQFDGVSKNTYLKVDGLSDVYRYVLFDDVKNCLFPLRSKFAKKNTVYNFLNLLSIPLNNGLSSNSFMIQDPILMPDLTEPSFNKKFWIGENEETAITLNSFSSPRRPLEKFIVPPLCLVPQTYLNALPRIYGWPGLLSEDLFLIQRHTKPTKDVFTRRQIQKINIARLTAE